MQHIMGITGEGKHSEVQEPIADSQHRSWLKLLQGMGPKQPPLGYTSSILSTKLSQPAVCCTHTKIYTDPAFLPQEMSPRDLT